MSNSDTSEAVDFGAAAAYRIVVQGTLREEWSDRFAGMTITPSAPGAGTPRTVLVGTLQDHAELFGVLDALYTLHLPLLHLERMSQEREESS